MHSDENYNMGLVSTLAIMISILTLVMVPSLSVQVREDNAAGSGHRSAVLCRQTVGQFLADWMGTSAIGGQFFFNFLAAFNT
jgi:hypothetical protein